MGEIVQFNDYYKSCRSCANLVRMDKNTYLCTQMEFENGTDVYPIENGEKTVGYNICNGEEYVRKRGKRNDKRDSI